MPHSTKVGRVSIRERLRALEDLAQAGSTRHHSQEFSAPGRRPDSSAISATPQRSLRLKLFFFFSAATSRTQQKKPQIEEQEVRSSEGAKEITVAAPRTRCFWLCDLCEFSAV